MTRPTKDQRPYTRSNCVHCGRPFAIMRDGQFLVAPDMQFRPDSSLCDACQAPVVAAIIGPAMKEAAR